MAVPFTEHHITIAGKRRTFWAYVPEGFTKAVIGLHGAHGTGEGFGHKIDFYVQADAGIAGVFPTALRWEGRRAWAVTGPQFQEERQFLLTLKQWLLEHGATGVGLTGNSSGGYMSWAMAFHDPKQDDGLFAFYGPSNANWSKGYTPHQQPVPVFISHGTNDQKVPFEGTEEQWGWRDSLWRMARINNGGQATDPAEAKTETVRSCFAKTATLIQPATSEVAVGGARVNGGRHGYHSCGRWQMQQMMIDWADRNGLWSG
jgi:poly(3-hydroxybutyrate) depolymerase